MSEWQPIESAPRDKSVLFLCSRYMISNGYCIVQVVWHPGYECYIAPNGLPVNNATHWMPLPPPPTA